MEIEGMTDEAWKETEKWDTRVEIEKVEEVEIKTYSR